MKRPPYPMKDAAVLSMEHTGFEPVTSTMPLWRAPNCANAPKQFKIIPFYTRERNNCRNNFQS